MRSSTPKESSSLKNNVDDSFNRCHSSYAALSSLPTRSKLKVSASIPPMGCRFQHEKGSSDSSSSDEGTMFSSESSEYEHDQTRVLFKDLKKEHKLSQKDLDKKRSKYERQEKKAVKKRKKLKEMHHINEHFNVTKFE